MRVLYLLFLLLLSGNVFSQKLTVSSNQLTFGTTYETVTDSLSITLTNTSNSNQLIKTIRFYQLYNSNSFSVNDSSFTIPAFGNYTLWVRFKPVHNVFYNSEMVLITDTYEGNISIDLSGQGRYSMVYYDHTQNLSEQQLKDSLKAITGRGYVSLGYNGARDKMFMNVDNKKVNGQGTTSNTLECVYTGRNAVGYTSRSNCQSAFSFNTEHTYPQSYFGSAEPMQSDLFHLYPTDDAANNVRSSYRFGMVVDSLATWDSAGSQFLLPFFEPRDAHKGEVARAMFYFTVRYQNYQSFLTTQESTLRTWLKQFPPSTIEKKRDTDIFFYQKNHNPFINYPQFIDRISSISNSSIASPISSLDLTDSIINYGFVSSGNPHIYNLVLVNNGTSPINFTNFSVSNSSILSFASGSGIPSTLLPGEDLTVQLVLTTSTSDSLFEFLNFDTNLPNAFTFHIPVFANFYQLPLNLSEHELPAPQFQLYPNPATQFVRINYTLNGAQSGIFNLQDCLGRKIYSEVLNGSNHDYTLSLEGLTKGIYFGSIQSGGRIEYKKLLIVN